VVRRLLIANRGEIAVRLIRACREVGIEPVAACTGREIGSMAAELADGVAPIESYLDPSGLARAAVEAGADAIHPGYGFLSEDARLAEAAIAAGVTWVGPPPEAMRALADKIRARELAEQAGVPVVPGATGDDAELAAAARDLGTPLMVKAAAGGGGRGMRAVDDLVDVPGAIAAAHQEAVAAFGDDRVFLERRLGAAKHVEVQVVADMHGGVIALGERECSLQRRHQKVLEEAPSPAVSSDLRERLSEAATAIASAAGYVNAGTVEFLLLPDGSFRFLEMNARLQVEHPVTEAVTGLDLVHAQLAIADGGRVPDAPELRGHAIEVRVYAEDPANGFLPAGGHVERLDLPQWPGVRIDTALRRGDAVTFDFDPLLAKVIAVAEDRSACLARLRAALAAIHIVGVTTNLGFLLEILHDPDVIDGNTDTEWIERTWRGRPPPLPDGAVASTAAARDPWHAFGGTPPASREVVVAGRWAQHRGWAYRVGGDELDPVDLPPPGGSLTAPMPASVRTIHVGEGDRVAAGDAMVVLEAMKMQTTVRTPAAGTVTAVRVREGEAVVAGQVLVEIDQEAR
jgi:3-methylcrotonyl-CoA carboxylase alpha subunit